MVSQPHAMSTSPTTRDTMLEMLDAYIELINEGNPFGQVKSGCLRVRGSLAKGTVFMHKSQSRVRHFNLSANKHDFSRVILDNGVEEFTAE